MAFDQEGHTLTNYAGNVMVRSNKGGYRGGEVKNLYNSGIEHNLDTFHRSITNGIYENPTVERSVNATLACILARRGNWTKDRADLGRTDQRQQEDRSRSHRSEGMILSNGSVRSAS